MTAIQPVTTNFRPAGELMPNLHLPAASFVLGVALNCYAGTNWMNIALTGYSLFSLVNRTITWKNSPDFELSENTEPLNEQNLAHAIDRLYEEITICGLQGDNRLVAQRRYMDLMRLARLSPPGIDALKRLVVISNVLLREGNKPLLGTIAYDIDRLYEEMVQQGLTNTLPFQIRWNELYTFLSNLSQEEQNQHPEEFSKLIALKDILQAHPEALKSSSDFSSYQASRLAYETVKKGMPTFEARARFQALNAMTQSLQADYSNADEAISRAFSRKAATALERVRHHFPTRAAASTAETQTEGNDQETAMRMALDRVNPESTTSAISERPSIPSTPRIGPDLNTPSIPPLTLSTDVGQPVLNAVEMRAVRLTLRYRRMGYDETTALNMAWAEIDRENHTTLRSTPTRIAQIFSPRAPTRIVLPQRIPGPRSPILDIMDGLVFNGLNQGGLRRYAILSQRSGAPAVIQLDQRAIGTAQGLTLSRAAKTTCPQAPQVEQDPQVNQIPLTELLDHYDRLFPPNVRYQAGSLARVHVEKVLEFARNELSGEDHVNPAYTEGYQLGLRMLIGELRNPEIADDLKRGALFALTSWSQESFGCHPRRYEDLYLQVDSLRNKGRTFRERVLFWNATDKEDLIKRCCLNSGVGASVIVHHINKARRDIGRQWGLKQDPVSLTDSYIERYASARSARDYAMYLEQNFVPSYMIQQTKERMSHNADNRSIFNNEVERLGQLGQLPDDWDETFFEVDPNNHNHRNPSYKGVAFVLEANGLLERARVVAP